MITNLTKIVLAATLFTSTVTQANIDKPDTYVIANYIHNEYKRPVGQAMQIAEAVVKASQDFSVSNTLIMALIAKESSFIPNASYYGAVGLTMVVENVHRSRLHGKNLRNIDTNVSTGIRLFRECLNSMHNNTATALALYNRGCSIEKTKHKMERKIKEGYKYASWILKKKEQIVQALSNIQTQPKGEKSWNRKKHS